MGNAKHFEEAPSAKYPKGRVFVTDGEDARYPDEMPNLDNLSPREVTRWVSGQWSRALDARQPEIERMHMFERIYRGWHYLSPEDNRRLEITNHPFKVVETLHAILSEYRPRIEIVPRRQGMTPDHVSKLNDFATYIQDVGNVDRAFRQNLRTKLKYGMCCYVIGVDPDSGLPFALPWSPYDVYFDPSANSLPNCEYIFLAGPVPTRRLQAMFPQAADRIKADNYTSPGYDVFVHPYLEIYGTGRYGRSMTGPRITNEDSHVPSNPMPSGGTEYVFRSSGQDMRHNGSDTTFFVQMLVRDDTRWVRHWEGTYIEQGPVGEIQYPGTYRESDVPCCESGWRCIQLTGMGEMIDASPLDPAFGGLNLVLGFDPEDEGRIGGEGVIGQIWPITRAYNERKNVLNAALRLEGVPVLKVTKGSGINWNQSGVMAGDVLEHNRGSEIAWLEYSGPGQFQFEHLSTEKQDIADIMGVHNSLVGDREIGSETGVAMRTLAEAAQVRIRGKNPVLMDERYQLVKKMMAIAGRKMSRSLMFYATGGEPLTITPEEVQDEWDVRPTEGTGTAQSKKDLADLSIQLYSMKAISTQTLLKNTGFPDPEEETQRVVQEQMLMAQGAALATNMHTPPPAPPGDGGGGPSPGGQ